MDTPQVLLDHHLKTLRLPTFLREYDKVAQQCAAEGVDFPRYLLRLNELELLDRERRATERRIRQAKFDVVKSLDSFDFLAIPSLNNALVGARHALHALIIRAQFQPKASALQSGKHGVVFFRHRMTA